MTIRTLIAMLPEVYEYYKALFITSMDRFAERVNAQQEARIFHSISECKHPEICPYYGHREAWEAGQIEPGIGLHNKEARDELEQAVHGL